MINITEVLTALAAQRPLFHSEADFQHAFAWEIHRRLPDALVRLELPLLHGNTPLHLDTWVAQGDTQLAVELKYKTRALSMRVGDEGFRLKNQAAQPCGRYDFIKDIQRLEQVTAGKGNTVGYAVLLTNESGYWTPSTRPRSVDADFRLHEGRILRGILNWGADAAAGTKRGRERPLSLKGTYTVHWEDYSEPSAERYGRFRHLLVRVSDQEHHGGLS